VYAKQKYEQAVKVPDIGMPQSGREFMTGKNATKVECV